MSETTHTAGRELDAVVAEAMGWQPLDDGSGGWRSADGEVKHWPGPPFFSTKIEDAWKIVERARTSGMPFLLNFTEELSFTICERLGKRVGKLTPLALVLYAEPVDFCNALLTALRNV